MTTTPTKLRRAYEVLGAVMDGMPDSVQIFAWAIDHTNAIRAQRRPATVGESDEEIRTAIRKLADHFGLKYGEERCKTYVDVRAFGEIDGVQVIIWGHVERVYEVTQ
jgi:hypothetical protein